MAFTPPTIDDFKTQFFRDFAYAVPVGGSGGDNTDLSKVTDLDITNALAMAGVNINPAIFPTQAIYTMGYNMLSAHFLCQSLQAAAQGLGGSAQWLTVGKTVGDISESFNIPEKILRSPFLALLSKTSYGCTYLSMISPLLVGNVIGIQGVQSAE